MSSKKRKRSIFSADESDEELNSEILHEEETSFESNRSRRKTFLSTMHTDRNTVNSIDKGNVGVAEYHIMEDDLYEFSSTEHEIVAHTTRLEDKPEADLKDEDDSDEDDSDLDDSDLDEDKPPVKPRYRSLDDFRELCSEFLEQFMRKICPSSVSEVCTSCNTPGESIICLDCFLFKTRCQSCILLEHRFLPLHRLQFFDSSTWKPISLRELGLIVYLGHDRKICPAASEAKKMVVIDMTGIQEVNVSFCTCGNLVGVDATERAQLINHGWYPATTEHPGTVATFAVLDTFEALSGEGKLSGYHFYKSLVRIRDGPGYQSIPRRYEEFMRMTREYQYLKLLMRAGKMTNEGFDLVVSEGELGLECPACPHPGRNIPKDWDKRIDSWIYTLYVMVDANFRLKSKKKRSVNDRDLGGGSSYFVKDEPYKTHLKGVTEQKEIKYCNSGLRAIDHANLKGGSHYNASGVVGVQCRHMLIRTNGVGDLQKGEKYANVDYVLLSSLRNLDLKRVILSYDIACQYSRNFNSRMLKFNEDMQLDTSRVSLRFVIPQFHIAGHGEKCRTRYNLRFQEHVGRTDGENIERGWAGLNPLSMASKEMGEGARHDYLDWHIGDWNYQRVVSFGLLFTRKLKEAVDESLKHSDVVEELRKNLPKGSIKEIEDNIKKWDEDPDNSFDPYAESSHGKQLLKVREILTESEMKESPLSSFEGTSAVHWLTLGLELEDTQHTIKMLYRNRKENRASAIGVNAVEKNAQAIRKIRAWRSKQVSFIPSIAELPEWGSFLYDDKTALRCWKVDLYMPSSILAKQQHNVLCPPSLVEKECKLRKAQAYDCLTEIRLILQKLWWLTSKKRQHVSGPGQKINTKSSLAIQVLVDRREKQVARYRRARAALNVLQPSGKWEKYFKTLRDDDIRAIEDDQGKGEGRRSPSWIWTGAGAADSGNEDNNIHQVLKVEYAKSRARARRWLEEAQLIREEMRRVLCYFNWKIGWWLERNSRLKDRGGDAAAGAIVYGNRQIFILQQLGHKFRTKWSLECNIKDLPVVHHDNLAPVKEVPAIPVIMDESGGMLD